MARLTHILTRTGDDGSTGLADGARRPKDDPRIHLLGELDEFNAQLGVLRSRLDDRELHETIFELQQLLFDLGGEIAIPSSHRITGEQVRRIEDLIDYFGSGLPPLREFLVPGDGQLSALAHLARAVCRRAERAAVSLARAEPLHPEGLVLLNRCSDLLFIIARRLGRAEAERESMWQREELE